MSLFICTTAVKNVLPLISLTNTFTGYIYINITFIRKLVKFKITNQKLDYVSIGKIVAIHGLRGEVILQHILGKKTSLKGLQTLFTQDRLFTYFPWFIKEAKSKSITETYLIIEDITTPEAARKLLQQTIWLPKTEALQYTASTSTLSLIGSTVINDGRKLGDIIEVIKQPHQLLCTIIIKEKEVYIPLHAETLVKVDVARKLVYVDLPDGLLELYL